MAAVTNAYFRRERTTSPMAALLILADVMVVSEIGARLSPKQPPDTMAPASTAGLAPIMTPAG